MRASAITAQLLEDRSLTRSDLAARIGVNEATISRFLRGLHTPTIALVEKIADEFGVSVDYLLGRTENPITRGANEEEFYRLYFAYNNASKRDRRIIRTILDLDEGGE